MRSKIAKAMKKSDASLSLIASNLLAGKYSTKADLAKVKASVGNAMTNSENAFVALIQPASNGRKGLASIANEDFDCAVTEVAQTQIKAHILAKVIEAELEDLEDSEPSEDIDVVDFGTEGDDTIEEETEVEGDEPETEADSSEVIDTEGSEEETEVEEAEEETEEETEVEGDEPETEEETEVEGEETEASEEDENEDIDEENFDGDLDLEFEAGDDLDLEEGEDDISNYFEDESEIKAAKKATTASKKRTASNGLDDLFNFKDN